MKTKLLLLAALVAGFIGSVSAAEDIAVVNDARVNVRGQASFNGEVITQLKKGEKVVILEEITLPKPRKGEPAKWFRIALPANTPVWVNANYVKENVVSVPKLNVRSGPGENFSVIARLEKGATVKEIRTVGDWKEIEAPAGASAFVAADLLLRQDNSAGTVLADAKPSPAPATEKPKSAPKAGKRAPGKAAPPPPAPAPVETVKVEPTPPPVVANSEVTKPAAKPAPPAATKPVEVAAVPPPTPPAAEPPAVRPTTSEPVVTPVVNKTEQSAEKKGFFSRLFGKSSKTNATETTKVAAAEKSKTAKAEAKTKAPAKAAAKPAAVVDTEPLAPRIVTREGIVRRSYNIQAPSDYALESTETGKIINYLYTTNTNLPWGALKGRGVIVTGQEAIDRRWPNTPVLTIETLSTVP